MANRTYLPNSKDYFINGSNPALFELVSDESTVNYLKVEDTLAPNHGRTNIQTLSGNITLFYKSNVDDVTYVFYNGIIATLASDGTLTTVANIDTETGSLQVAENRNDQLGIVNGVGYYYFNKTTHVVTNVPVGQDNFTLTNPTTIIMMDNIFYVGDSQAGAVQATVPNNAALFQETFEVFYTSDAGLLMTLAVSEKVIYFIGNNGIERWVEVGGQQLIQRDSVYLEPYGLSVLNSFASKINLLAGIYESKEGDARVIVYTEGSDQGNPISTPGIMKKMLNSGACLGSDIYEIDQYVFYEVVFETQSFIYNFNNGTWVQSTQPRTQVVDIGGVNFGAYKNLLFQLTPYHNDQKKIRRGAQAIVHPEFGRMTVDEARFFYSNDNPQGIESNDVLISACLDGVWEQPTPIQRHTINPDIYYGFISRQFNADCYQVGFEISTYSNVIWRAMSAVVSDLENY